MSLRWRIALALAAIAAATTISVGLASYRATSTRLLQEIDSSLYSAWQTVDNNSLYQGNGELLYIVQVTLPSGRVGTLGGRSGIDARDGVLKARADPTSMHYDVVRSNGSDVRVVSGVATNPAWRGAVVQVGRPLDENDRVLHDLKTRTMLLVVVVTAAAAALGWLIAGSVSGPLARLTKAASDVEKSGRLDVDVPVAGNDEVGRLGSAFNGMLGALAASRDDQRRLVEDAGHELRTPLTSVRTNLAVLRRHPDLDAETRAQIIDDLHAETEELVVLVEEVVALARGLDRRRPGGTGRAPGDGRRRGPARRASPRSGRDRARR